MMSGIAKEIYIVGAGGFGREVADIVRAVNAAAAEPVFCIAGFVDDDETLWGEAANDVHVIGSVESLRELAVGGARPYAVMAIGNPQVKRTIAERLGDSVAWETVIHPSAIISPYAEIGEGTIVNAYSFVKCNVVMGKHCCLNSTSSIGHDAVLGDYVSVMCHCDITGADKLEEGVYIATSVAIIPGVTVGKDAFVGAGSVVLKDVEAGTRVFGQPARRTG
jgi:sugar O-acyltransferase (sialic acid O-acetyltransferase NeuD family)